MQITEDWQNRAQEIAELFGATFAASEGAEEGRAIGALARDLLATTPAEELRVFLALGPWRSRPTGRGGASGRR